MAFLDIQWDDYTIVSTQSFVCENRMKVTDVLQDVFISLVKIVGHLMLRTEKFLIVQILYECTSARQQTAFKKVMFRCKTPKMQLSG